MEVIQQQRLWLNNLKIQDPKLYRTAEEIKEKGFMSMWRTQEWCDFAKHYQANLVHFDQGPMGHECRKPTTLAVIALSELHQLQDVRGKGVGPPVEGQQPPRPRSEMEMGERIAQSKLWACWAPGLKAAIAEALRRWMFAKAPATGSHGSATNSNNTIRGSSSASAMETALSSRPHAC